MKWPVQIVQVRNAYAGVRGGILEEKGPASLTRNIVGTVPKLAIENDRLTIGNLRSKQEAPLVPRLSPSNNIFVGGFIPAHA